MADRLLRKVRKTDATKLEDLLLVMAKNVENSLIEGGAVPGKDYTIRDLYTWGLPFALSVFDSEKADIEFAVEF